MADTPQIILKLETLADGIPVIPEVAVEFYKQNCMMCFDHSNHKSNVSMSVNHDNQDSNATVIWNGDVSELMRKQYGDLVKATDYAACTIALLIVRELTQYTGIEQSAIGTSIDYYLAPQNKDDILIFNHAARLEVSGILMENTGNTINARIREKINRLKADPNLPTIIIIVEFSKPQAKMVYI